MKQVSNNQIFDLIKELGQDVKEVKENNELILMSINQFSTETDQRFNGIDNRLDNLKTGQGYLKNKVNNLESGQDDIKFSLANKVNDFDFKELEKRVNLLTSN